MAQEIFDVVCGERLDPVLAPYEYVYQDKMYYFCSDRCCQLFQQNPEKYADPKFAGNYGVEAHGEELEEPAHPEHIRTV